jgi:hypothetical protein
MISMDSALPSLLALRRDELLQEQWSEQAGEHAHGEEESGPAGHPSAGRRVRCRLAGKKPEKEAAAKKSAAKSQRKSAQRLLTRSIPRWHGCVEVDRKPSANPLRMEQKWSFVS